MEVLRGLVHQAFAVDSFASVVIRGVIWLAVSIIILLSVDRPDPEKSIKSLKTNLGFFLMFLILSGGLVYWLFGFSIQG